MYCNKSEKCVYTITEFGVYQPLYDFYYELIERSIKELALENEEYVYTKEKVVKRLIRDMSKV